MLSIPLSAGGSLERVFPIVLLSAFLFVSAIRRAFRYYGFPLFLILALGMTSILPYIFFSTDGESIQMMHTYWMGLTMFFFTVLCMQDVNYLKKVILCLIVAMCVLLLKGMLLSDVLAHKAIEVIPGQNRLVTEIGHPNYLGGFILLILPFSLLIPEVLFKSAKGYKGFVILTNGILILGLILSYSRSAWLGFLVLIIIITLRNPWVILGVFLMGLVLIFSLQDFNVDAVTAGHPVIKRLLSVMNFQDDPNFLERLYVWKSSLRIGSDHMLSGIGLGNIPFYRQIEIYRQPESIMLMPHPHNIFLQFWVSFGVLGVMLFGLILWTGFYRAINQTSIQDNFYKYIRQAALISVISVMIYGLFDCPVFSDRVVHVFWFVVALLYFRPPLQARSQPEPQ